MLYKGSLHTWHSGGVAIKLKMGKSEDNSAEDTEEEKVTASPISEEEKPETAEETPSKTDEKEDEKPAEDEKKDVESLRKVIKVDQTEEKKDEEPAEDDNKEEKKPTEPVKEDKAPSDKGGSAGGDEAAETDPSSGRESLEQKRAILQNIKDFDFQIKKNQEELSSVNKKIGGMSKDLDDLVSLYEIVSEQMNPFVGLSKVTKKRLDALENFTREIDGLKERMGEMESFAERSGAKIQSLGQIKQKVKTIDTDALIAQMDDVRGEAEEDKKTEGAEESGEKTSEEESKQPETEGEKEGKEKAETATSEGEHAEEVSDEKDVDTEGSGEISKEEEGEDISYGEEASEEILPSTTTAEVPEDIFDSDIFGDIPTGETLQPMSVDLSPMDDDIFGESFDMDLDMIFEMAFGALSASAEGKIDMIIDEFIESLKGQNVN